jgi:hypothetical protein
MVQLEEGGADTGNTGADKGASSSARSGENSGADTGPDLAAQITCSDHGGQTGHPVCDGVAGFPCETLDLAHLARGDRIIAPLRLTLLCGVHFIGGADVLACRDQRIADAVEIELVLGYRAHAAKDRLAAVAQGVIDLTQHAY